MLIDHAQHHLYSTIFIIFSNTNTHMAEHTHILKHTPVDGPFVDLLGLAGAVACNLGLVDGVQLLKVH